MGIFQSFLKQPKLISFGALNQFFNIILENSFFATLEEYHFSDLFLINLMINLIPEKIHL